MDKSELSKRKYIYRIYKDGKDMVHIEKFPVIYANSTVVYYKVANKQDLYRIYMRWIQDTFRACDLGGRVREVYCWDVDEVAMADVEKVRADMMRAVRESRLRELRLREKQHRGNLEDVLREIEKLEKESEE